MQLVCRIDREILRVAGLDVLTGDVVLTEPQLQHIRKTHPNDYEQYQHCLEQILLEPDFIFEATRPDSAVFTKTIQENGKSFKLVLRLKTTEDPDYYANSVITFMKSDAQELSRMARNKKVLYKRV